MWAPAADGARGAGDARDDDADAAAVDGGDAAAAAVAADDGGDVAVVVDAVASDSVMLGHEPSMAKK